jgi:hypothetical protein
MPAKDVTAQTLVREEHPLSEQIGGVGIPDTIQVADATELVPEAPTPLLLKLDGVIGITGVQLRQDLEPALGDGGRQSVGQHLRAMGRGRRQVEACQFRRLVVVGGVAPTNQDTQVAHPLVRTFVQPHQHDGGGFRATHVAPQAQALDEQALGLAQPGPARVSKELCQI